MNNKQIKLFMNNEDFDKNFTVHFTKTMVGDKMQKQVIIISKSDSNKRVPINLNYNEHQFDDLRQMTPYEVNVNDLILQALHAASIALDNKNDNADLA
jgi:hypothetical protein